MTRIGFHASHEQISPAALLHDVQHAEKAGFAMAMCSDHFSPWSARQGHSGYTWSWLGAALATTNLTMGCVSAPGQRYHPAVAAQKIATLSQMFEGRFWVALGSGEASNEHITGETWPRKEVRDQRLDECVDVIRRLLAGEVVSHDGLVTVDRARLWDLPEQQPKLLAPVVSTQSAARVASWADGLITVLQPIDDLRRVIDSYRDAGGRGDLALQLHLSWASSEDEAESIAHDQWRSNVFGAPVSWDTETAEAFDLVSDKVTVEQVRESVRVSSDLGRHREWIHELAELGFDDIYLHHVGQEQRAFIDAFGSEVLPGLAASHDRQA
ncbi:TIGR03885 family FMN-dependent LLM class oxidoreductase [Knoellia sp. S7-12]|uniref:TIGR03885 family FMN-dependent LLM class oxidoreductase n=1 Tax=Knoellia sp. S7-12 TaxID=3126698 RepID=UPI00336633AF